FDVLVGMDRLSKRKFGIVCHEKVVRIPLEGDEILRVHGERTQGVVKTLMNTKVGESKLSDIFVVRDFIEVFPEDLSMTTTTTSGVPHRFGSWSDEHQCRLLRRGAWSSYEVSVGITEEGEVVTYLRFIANFSKIVKPHNSLTERNQKKEQVKPSRVRAMDMTIQYGVRGMILAAQSEAFKQENVLAESVTWYNKWKRRADDGCTLWIKLYSKYEYETLYHPSKENVVIEALRGKERVKPRRRVMAMTI
ncbi:hypothetical protein Tco_1087147, partial [Tanacetum coccineum]